MLDDGSFRAGIIEYELGCEHAMLMDMLYDRHFQVPEKFAEECAEFRKRVGRRKGLQQVENEKRGKKSEGDVIILGGGDESDEEESMPLRELDRIVHRRGAGIPGCQVISGGEAFKPGTILLPSWRKVGGTDSELSGESTYASDGKMGRWVPVAYKPRDNMQWELLVRI